MKKTILLCMLLALCVSTNVKAAGKKELSDYQKNNAEAIADIVTNEYDEYGVLPSMAVAQALNESSLGVNAETYNWFGILHNGIKDKYWSLDEGVHSYMRVINYKRYAGATFNTDYVDVARKIIYGGYFSGDRDNYYRDILWLYNAYNLKQYDEALYIKLKERDKNKKAASITSKAAISNDVVTKSAIEISNVKSDLTIKQIISYVRSNPKHIFNVLKMIG